MSDNNNIIDVPVNPSADEPSALALAIPEQLKSTPLLRIIHANLSDRVNFLARTANHTLADFTTERVRAEQVLRSLLDHPDFPDTQRNALLQFIQRAVDVDETLTAAAERAWVPPTLALKQGTTRIEGTDGVLSGKMFFTPGIEVVPDGLVFRVLFQHKMCIRFQRDAQGKAVLGPPLCVALDGDYGVGDPGGPCLSCQHIPFGRAPSGGPGKFTECDYQLVYVCIAEPDKRVFMLRFSRTSMKAGNALQAIVTATSGGWAGAPPVQISSKKEENSNGTYYRFVVVPSQTAAQVVKDPAYVAAAESGKPLPITPQNSEFALLWSLRTYLFALWNETRARRYEQLLVSDQQLQNAEDEPNVQQALAAFDDVPDLVATTPGRGGAQHLPRPSTSIPGRPRG